MAKCTDCNAYVHEKGETCIACQKKFEEQRKQKEDKDNGKSV